MKSRGQVDLIKTAITTGAGLVGAFVVWMSSATWTRHEFVADQARAVADHERRIVAVVERVDRLTGQVERIESASVRSADSAGRLEAVVTRLEAALSKKGKQP